MTEEQQARHFWQWFDQERNKYLFIHQVDEEERDRLLDALIDALHEYHEHLFFEIGAPPQQEKGKSGRLPGRSKCTPAGINLYPGKPAHHSFPG